MKATFSLLAALLGFGAANATTVTGSGGTTGAQFVNGFGEFLTPSNSTVQVGTFNEGSGIFTQFAALDATPINFGTTTSLQGRWLGNFADTSAGANAFSGSPIWVLILILNQSGGLSFRGLFRSTVLFPMNGGGVGDSVNLPGSSLTYVAPMVSSPGSRSFIAPGDGFPSGRVIVGMPEPSTALLSLLGVAGLIRRRR